MGLNLCPHVQKLSLFSRVAERKSFKHAAADAGVTLSALSQAVTALERILGKTLIVRSRSPLALTEAGEELLAGAEPILAALTELGNHGRASTGDRPIKLRLGLYDTVAENHLPHLLPRLQREFPRLTIQLRTARSAVLERLLRDGELDAITVVRDPGVVDERADVLAVGEFAFFASASETAIDWTIAERKGIALLAPNPGGYGGYLRKFLDSYAAFFHQEGIKWRVALTADSLETLRRLAAVGLVVAVLPVRVARRFPNQVVMLKLPPSARVDRGAHEFCLVTRPSVDSGLRRVLKRELTQILATVD
jgi:LysR family hydrogen peroxide-inducible transcriptional activator